MDSNSILKHIILDEPTRNVIFDLSQDLSNLVAWPQEPDRLSMLFLAAHELPRTVREQLQEFKIEETFRALMFHGLPIDEQRIGPTPPSYHDGSQRRLNNAEIIHGMFSSLLGYPFGYASQQNGCVFNQIVAIPEKAGVANSSAGSEHDFAFHTEDAFHPTPPEYLGLICIRNLEKAPTVLSTILPDDLTSETAEVLRTPNFNVTVNAAHGTLAGQSARQIPILFGHPDRPYLRINVHDMIEVNRQEPFASALREVLTVLHRNRTAVTLTGGDALYIDNCRLVHGRDKYQPRYGPEGRWLIRLVMSGSLRKTSELRDHPTSSVLNNPQL